MDLKLDYDTLIENNLTLSEYAYLQALYEEENDDRIYKVIDRIEEDSLQERGFVKITEGKVILRKKGIILFEGDDLFLRFLNSFPIKTPSGRYLSPLRNKGMSVDRIRKKWDKLFGKHPALQQKALDVLDAELAWRRSTGQMEYINNIETWLNQANYEKYEYLLEQDTGQQNDLM